MGLLKKKGMSTLFQSVCWDYKICFFNDAIPNTCTWQNGCTDEEAAIIRAAAAKYCLPQA